MQKFQNASVSMYIEIDVCWKDQSSDFFQTVKDTRMCQGVLKVIQFSCTYRLFVRYMGQSIQEWTK